MFEYAFIAVDKHGQPHLFSLNNGNTYATFREALDWAQSQFGAPMIRSRWTCGGVSLWFRDEHDALHFRLRWC